MLESKNAAPPQKPREPSPELEWVFAQLREHAGVTQEIIDAGNGHSFEFIGTRTDLKARDETVIRGDIHGVTHTIAHPSTDPHAHALVVNIHPAVIAWTSARTLDHDHPHREFRTVVAFVLEPGHVYPWRAIDAAGGRVRLAGMLRFVL